MTTGDGVSETNRICDEVLAARRREFHNAGNTKGFDMAQSLARPQTEPAGAAIEVLRHGPTIGAEIRGVDFARPIARAAADAIHAALMAQGGVYAAMWQRQQEADERAAALAAVAAAD